MKVYRGPRSGGKWSLTDSQEPREYLEEWMTPGEMITVDGTIKKEGERHTVLGLEIEERDVVALFNALVKRYRRDLKKSQKEAETLVRAMRKIYSLTASHKATSKEALVQAVQSIAWHYRWHFAEGKPEIGWIKWDSI